MALEFAERIRRIPVYPVAAGYDLGEDMAMLASNESPFAPQEAVSAAAARALAGATAIPTPSYEPLRTALSERYGLAPERIALGSGSCDILLAAGDALLEPGAEVVYAWPAFSVYPHLGCRLGRPRDRGAARLRGATTTSTQCSPRSRSRPASC